MNFNIRPQTVFLFVGPTNCGKTYFSENYLLPFLYSKFKNVQYISSDNIRRALLGDSSYSKYDHQMLYASQGAFTLLFKLLEESMKFPVNADAIVIDSTGLDSNFRQQVKDLTYKYYYNLEGVIFNYKNRKSYYQFGGNKRAISLNVDKLFKYTLKNLKVFDKAHRISSNNFEEIIFSEHPINELYNKCFFPDDWSCSIIGDIHGCFDELIQLINKLGFEIENGKIIPRENWKIILVGDFIDKGPQVKEVVDFIYENQETFYVVQGNHENFVINYVNNEKSYGQTDQTVVQTYFDSVNFFQNNPASFEKLEDIFNSGVPFLKGKGFIVTHSPCLNEVIGKIKLSARKQQRNFRYNRQGDLELHDYEVQLEKDLNHLQEGAFNFPYHVFGHVATSQIFRIKNHVGIDTGCEAGGYLSAFTVHPSRRIFRDSVVSTREKRFLPSIFAERNSPPIDFSLLEPREYGRIKWMAKRSVNFLSGTMCPADKIEKENNLESLWWALNYYKEEGYSLVMLQKKYMGSRCNVYLFKNIEDCYAVTRNGYVVKPDYINLEPVYKSLQNLFESKFTSGYKALILDGELMPWSVLGKGLIEKSFVSLSKMIHNEVNFLEQYNFLSHLYKTQKISSKTDLSNAKKAKEELSDHMFKTLSAVRDFSIIPFDLQRLYLETYDRQLELYGKDSGDPYFLPFNLLKIIYEDDTEEINYSQFDGFLDVSSDKVIIIQLSDLSQAYNSAQKFYASVVSDGIEGVVVKPDLVKKNVAPYLKVRNDNYLTMVYGYDWKSPKKHEGLMKQKRIGRKIKLSIQEYETGMDMLAIPYNEINEDNEKYLQIAAKFVVEEKKERILDPRL